MSSRFYDAILKLLDEDSNTNESPSSDLLNAVTLSERDVDLDDRVATDRATDSGTYSQATDTSSEPDVLVEQFQLDTQSPEQVVDVQEHDTEETMEAVVTTAYGTDILTKSLIPNDLGFDFNEVVKKIDEDLNLSLGFDNLTFSEPDIVIPELTPVPGHLLERDTEVFSSTTNLRLLDTSE